MPAIPDIVVARDFASGLADLDREYARRSDDDEVDVELRTVAGNVSRDDGELLACRALQRRAQATQPPVTRESRQCARRLRPKTSAFGSVRA